MSELSTKKAQSKITPKYVIILTVAGIIINLIGTIIAMTFDLPLYLDAIGTVTAAAFGGFFPAVVAGFISNLIKGIWGAENIYYGIINILIAVCTGYFAKKGCFKKGIFKLLLLTVSLALISCIVGDLLGLLMDSVVTLENITGELTIYIHRVVKDMPVEFMDKAIAVAVATLIYRPTPARLKSLFRIDGWLQAPISPVMRKAASKNSVRRISLRAKILTIVITSALLIAVSATVVSFNLFKTSTINERTKLASAIANYAASSLNGNKVNEYLEKGEDAEGYNEYKKRLTYLKLGAPDVEYIYVYKIMEDGCHVVFDLDSEDFKGEANGYIEPFDESFMEYVPTLLAGGRIDPIVSNDSYGWLLTVYEPVYDSMGVCQAYVGVDVSMNQLRGYNHSFMAKLLSIIIGFLGLVLCVSVWLIRHNIILPVNTMAYCAGAFAYKNEEGIEKNVERIKSLDIRTGDEIEHLYKAFTKTTEDSLRYVEDIQQKTDTIQKMQNGLIMVLADMVESRDKCTGTHIKKTAAYVKLIVEEMRKRGFYKERLTDQFAEDVVNAAPLHDIGKIQIPDTVLNKPGKLTDEEFDLMKKHTVYGSEIIEKAMKTVTTSSYLEEAKNLAEFHHEKWNGKGYPHGISGEDIPLSARIMAVADVFDALVSERSYKKGFPFEKAMGIIEEDAGTHFDPLVAEAFIGASERVKKIAYEKNEA